jgi:hypothetical protein
MKRMTFTVYNTVECSLSTTQHVTMLLIFLQSRVSVRCLMQHMTRPEEEEGEVAEHKTSFLVALNGLKAAREHMSQFDIENNITAICNKVEIELYRPRTQEKKNKQTRLTELLKK